VCGGWTEEDGKDGWGVPKRRGAGLGVCVCVWDDGVVGAESGSRLGMGTGGFEDTMPVKKMI
jgi:hypothetical protein